MPFYTWVDTKTKKSSEVLRKIENYDKVPTKKEAKDLTPEEFKEAEWVRHISDDIKFLGPRYKGNWNAY